LPRARRVEIGADGRKEARAGLVDERLGLVVPRNGCGDIRIGGIDARFERVQLRIVEDFPPAVAWNAVGRAGELPRAAFLERGRDRGGRDLIRRRERARVQCEGGDEREGGSRGLRV